MKKPKTQFEQAQRASDNILLVMKRAASEIAKDIVSLEEAVRLSGSEAADGTVDVHNWHVFRAIAHDSRTFFDVAGQERRIVASTPLGRRR